jgi:hypothetical protein
MIILGNDGCERVYGPFNNHIPRDEANCYDPSVSHWLSLILAMCI